MASSTKQTGVKRSRSTYDVEFSVEEFLEAVPDTTEESMIMGIDEAGRGPALGDMVYGAAMVPLSHHEQLVQCGVADSKQLNEAKRDACLAMMKKLPEVQAFVQPLSAQFISHTMTGRHGKTLNTISHECAMNLIERGTLAARGKLAAVYVDTVGIPEVYERMLKSRFPHLKIVVAKKADSKYPIVSAASVFAKTARDAGMKAICRDLGIDESCSGYPSDERTGRWLYNNAHKFYGYPEPCVRLSWAPIMEVLKTHCVKIEWERDVEKERQQQGIDKDQRRLTFEKPPPARDVVFHSVLGLQTTFEL